MIDLGQEIDFSSEIEKLIKEHVEDFNKLNEFEKRAKAKEFEEYIQTAAQEFSQEIDTQEFKKPYLDTKFQNFIVMSNLPKVDYDKSQKLLSVLKMIHKKKEIDQHLVNITMGYDDNKVSNGFAMIEFDHEDNIKKGIQHLNNLQLDKNHTLKVYTLQEYEQIINTEDKLAEINILQQRELYQWNLENQINEQILFRTQGENVSVGWLDHLQDKVTPIFNKDLSEDQTETATVLNLNDQNITHTEFSIQGSYLVVHTQKGFSLYGGDKFIFINHFNHLDVKNVVFSQDEKFMFSYNGTIATTNSQENYIIWEVSTGKKVRSFKAEQDYNFIKGKKELYVFSPDSQYLYRKGPRDGYVTIYSLNQECKVKKTLENLKNLQNMVFWCPNNPHFKNKQMILLCMCYDKDSNGKIVTIDTENIMESTQYKWKTINQQISSISYDINSTYNSNQESMAGIFLEQKNKKNKKQNNVIVQYGIFNKKKLLIEDKDMGNKYQSFNLKYNKFVMITEDHNKQSGHTRWDFDFFVLNQNNNIIQQINAFKNKLANEVIFSNINEYFVMVNKCSTSPSQGVIEFCQFKQFENSYKVEILKEQRMDYLNECAYDPSGRFLLAFSKNTNSLKVYNSYGKVVYKNTFNSLNQVIWRNRPFVEVGLQKVNDIKNNYNEYKKKYEDMDDQIINKLKYELQEKENQMKIKFMEFIEMKRKKWEDSKQERVKLQGFDQDDLDDLVLDEQIIEEELLETNEVFDDLDEMSNN